MPVTQDRLTRLRGFGLSEYAARSYLALLDLGIGEARDVSSLSKVPQAKIYHVLEQLHDKGLVAILPEFPKKYAPVPFEDYLTRLYDEHTKAASAIDEERESLAEMFRVMGDTDVGDRGFFTVIRGRRNVLSRIEEMVGQTQKDLIILGTAGTAARASHLVTSLRHARSRSVRVRMIAPVDRETLAKLAPLADLTELRARELSEADQSAKVAIVISDSTRAFLIHFVPDDDNLNSGKDIGVFTDQVAMVAAIQAIVEPHWTRASTYESRQGELLHGRTPEFTRIYPTREEARIALARALGSGVELVRNLHASDLVADASNAKSWRAIFHVTDTRVLNTCQDMQKSHPNVDVRHLKTQTISHQVILDDREAFFGLAGDIVIHTNAPSVVRALGDQFESLWSLSESLEERRRDLAIFPRLEPGAVGIGRLFQIMRDAIFVVDPHDQIALSNPAAHGLLGLTDAKEFALGALVAPDDGKVFEERVARFREQKDANATDFFETTGIRSDGNPFPMEVTLSMLRTAEQGQYVVLVARDITARVKAQTAQLDADARVRRAYERMNEAFYALDSDFRFIYRNPAVKALQQRYTDDMIDGHVIWDAFPDLLGTKFETELKRAVAEKKHVRFEEHYAGMDMWFEVNAYPATDGLSVYFRDVSETKRTERATREKREGPPPTT